MGQIDYSQRPERLSKTVSPGHDRAITLMSSQQLWLPGQDQGSQYFIMEGPRDQKPLPLAV